MVKVAISGKGGVGKTTLAALLSRVMVTKGDSVIAIDADPAANLAATLGVPPEVRPTPIREMRRLILERTGASGDGYGQYFKLNPHVSDLPEKYSVLHEGVRLMVLGGITKGGGGCACPENALLKALLAHLIVVRNETVIVDMEAGIEHLGRATVAAVDALIVVLEPGRRSVDTAASIKKLAEEIGIKKILAVGNKVASPEQRRFIKGSLPGVPLLGTLSLHPEFAVADMEGRPPYEACPAAVEETERIYRNLLSHTSTTQPSCAGRSAAQNG